MRATSDAARAVPIQALAGNVFWKPRDEPDAGDRFVLAMVV
jgi:hypothetical protein